jgi:hypothetical protein
LRPACANIEPLARNISLGGGKERGGNVRCIDKVAGLRAVTNDCSFYRMQHLRTLYQANRAIAAIAFKALAAEQF